MSEKQVLLGFHAVTARLRHAASSIKDLYFDKQRRDKRMSNLIQSARDNGVQVHPVESDRLDALGGDSHHQGVVALASAMTLAVDIDEVLETIEGPPLLLVLDGVTDPHNLGACLRTADAAGVHAVIAPRDRSAGLSAVVRRVACGAAETLPYIMVTNLARTLRQLKDSGVWLVGTDETGEQGISDVDTKGPTAWVMGAEGEGMRRLTRELCDVLVRIPMNGSVESLNVSVATGVCLFESVRQRGQKTVTAS